MAAPLATTTEPLLPAPIAWARSGAMALTGHAHGLPSTGASAVAARAATLGAELGVRMGPGVPSVDGAALLGERAALLGLTRRGRVSPGGSCRLLATQRGMLAANLPRAEDRELLPAWLERDVPGDPWDALAAAFPEQPARHWVERGRLLGLAVAEAAPPGPAPASPVRVERIGVARERALHRPLVVDLSSLWAGPLASHLLQLGGARVVKIESTSRPDGARRGPSAFFDLLNAGKASVALDFTSERGRDALRRWISRADVVLEGSRPRALRQLGIEAEACLAEQPGLVWVSITGHGRREPGAGWAAFGDDAAVAAGLAVASGSADDPVFCADAVADPLAGLQAAVEAWRALERGGGCLLDVALVDAARSALGAEPPTPARVFRRDGIEHVACEGHAEPVAPPRARRPRGRARPLGADTERAC